MSNLAVLRPEAVQDLRDAHVWYECKQKGVGEAFLKRVEEQIALICENPSAFPMVLPSVQRARLKKFPYGVYFRATPGRIVILAIYHFKRFPRAWTSRT